MPRIVVLTGRSQPGECGVADYSAKLVKALAAQGVGATEVHVATMSELVSFVRMVSLDDVVHLQYPLLAWRKSLIPVVLMAMLKLRGHRRIALTLHEFSRAHWARRLICIALARMADVVLSTSRFESGPLARRLPAGARVSVIPIASNIAPDDESGTGPAARSGVVYFGLLAPGKGLEEFLDISAPLATQACPVTVAGQIVAGHSAWLQSLRGRYPQAQFRQSLRPEQVSEVLCAAAVAILPYPDGVSERRGSALAALAHGLQVITTRGNATTPELSEVCHLVGSVHEARELARKLLSDSAMRVEVGAIGRYVKSRSWPAIAASHLEAYHGLLSVQGKPTWK